MAQVEFGCRPSSQRPALPTSLASCTPPHAPAQPPDNRTPPGAQVPLLHLFAPEACTGENLEGNHIFTYLPPPNRVTVWSLRPAPSVINFDALQATNVAGGILPGSLRSTTWATVRDRAPDYQRLWRAKAAASDPLGGYSQRSDAGSRPSPHHLVPSPIDRSLLLVGRLRGGAPEDRDFGRRSRLTQSLIYNARRSTWGSPSR